LYVFFFFFGIVNICFCVGVDQREWWCDWAVAVLVICVSHRFFPQGLHGVTCVPCSLGSCFGYIIDGWDPVYQVARSNNSLPKCACYTRRELFSTLMLPLSMVWKLAL